ncbi:peptidase domain-containing ABC transporter [Spirochaeta cellobiosiphila]|uniref:peptidase domain-containing ABC transporter n=1 Tax=Spirochaeta cellobiosiphila TaxID=504483 RepID=UPI000421C83C|nr:ATP-binding cassette domain-containing protein [Spirochaeta cellobiosiphila]
MIYNYSTALLPLLNAMYWKGSIEYVMELYPQREDNLNEEQFKDILSKLGYDQLKGSYERAYIKSLEHPFVYVDEQNGLFVFIEDHGDYYTVYDCAQDKYVTQKSLGIISEVYCFIPSHKEKGTVHYIGTKWFTHILRQFNGEVIWLFLLSLFTSFLNFITPLLIILIYSQVQRTESFDTIKDLGIITFIFIMALAGFRYFKSVLQTNLAVKLDNIVGKEIYRRLMLFPLKLTENTPPEIQIARVRDFEKIRNFIKGPSFTSLIDLPFSLVMLVGLSFVAGPMAWFPVLGIFVLTILGLVTYLNYRDANDERSSLLGQMNLIMSELFQLLRIKNFPDGIKQLLINVVDKSRQVKQKTEDIDKVVQRVAHLGNLLTKICLVLAICFGVTRVVQNQMGLGTLFASFIIISRILNPVNGSLMVLTQLSSYRRSINQLNDFMSIPIKDIVFDNQEKSKNVRGRISFENVYLRYGREYTTTLYNLNFTIDPGSLVVILGHGSSGKSSLINCLLGNYPVTNGCVLLDNYNIKQFDRNTLRRFISYCPKNGVTFGGSIRDNFTLLNPKIKEYEIIDSLRSWDLWEYINNLDEGLDTDLVNIPSVDKVIFEKKLNLALLNVQEAKITIIDGFEYHLSNDYIKQVYSNVLALKNKSTNIIVTEYQPLIEAADQVIVLNEGRIIKQGKPQKVLNKQDKENLWGDVNG